MGRQGVRLTLLMAAGLVLCRILVWADEPQQQSGAWVPGDLPRKQVYVNPALEFMLGGPPGWSGRMFPEQPTRTSPVLKQVYKKSYEGREPKFPSMLGIWTIGPEAGQASASELMRQKLASLPAGAVVSGPAEATLGQTIWIVAEYQEELQTPQGMIQTRTKGYLTRRGDGAVFITGISMADQYGGDVLVFDRTVSEAYFGQDALSTVIKDAVEQRR